MSTYAVVIEKARRNYAAYVPDLPGCVAVGDTVQEVLAAIAEAIEFHLDGMRQDGQSIPKPTTVATNLSTHLAALGSKGGRAAAALLTPEQRRLRAAAAGRAGGRGRPRQQTTHGAGAQRPPRRAPAGKTPAGK